MSNILNNFKKIKLWKLLFYSGISAGVLVAAIALPIVLTNKNNGNDNTNPGGGGSTGGGSTGGGSTGGDTIGGDQIIDSAEMDIISEGLFLSLFGPTLNNDQKFTLNNELINNDSLRTTFVIVPENSATSPTVTWIADIGLTPDKNDMYSYSLKTSTVIGNQEPSVVSKTSKFNQNFHNKRLQLLKTLGLLKLDISNQELSSEQFQQLGEAYFTANFDIDNISLVSIDNVIAKKSTSSNFEYGINITYSQTENTDDVNVNDKENYELDISLIPSDDGSYASYIKSDTQPQEQRDSFSPSFISNWLSIGWIGSQKLNLLDLNFNSTDLDIIKQYISTLKINDGLTTNASFDDKQLTIQSGSQTIIYYLNPVAEGTNKGLYQISGLATDGSSEYFNSYEFWQILATQYVGGLVLLFQTV